MGAQKTIYNNNNIAINSSIINGKINTNKTTTVLTKYPLAKCREISRQVSENNNTKTICRRLNLWSGATVTLPFIKPAIISNRTRLIIFIILVLSYIYNYYILKNIYPQPWPFSQLLVLKAFNPTVTLTLTSSSIFTLTLNQHTTIGISLLAGSEALRTAPTNGRR